MPDSEFVNKKLISYLDNEEYKQYESLIEAIVKDDVSMGAKYNLWCLLMNHGTEKLCVENLTNQLYNLYSSDKDIEAYLNKIIHFNPKLNYISISAKSKQDMKHDFSLSIDLPVKSDPNVDKYFENAYKIIKRVKEVLTMILIESRTVSP